MYLIFLAAAVIGVACSPICNAAPENGLEEVASFPKQQVTGVAVSQEGRVFVNFPFWSDGHSISVAEILQDGTLKPYPDDRWNHKEGPAGQRWVCVQSVYIDDANNLWVLDPAAPKMGEIVKGGPKLVQVDLAENRIVKSISFDEDVAPPKSYLNDVRVDRKSGHAFLTDSGLGAIVIVDLESGAARRLLAESPLTKAEPGVELVVDGIKLLAPETGKTPQIHADGIALDLRQGYLYFHVLTGHTLYRVKTKDLLDEKLSDRELAKRVENVGQTAAPDGMLAGKDGAIYLAAFETNAIERWNGGTVDTLIQDKRLQWPDSLSWGPDGMLYITTSQIHRTPRFNKGESKQQDPFRVYRLRIE